MSHTFTHVAVCFQLSVVGIYFFDFWLCAWIHRDVLETVTWLTHCVSCRSIHPSLHPSRSFIFPCSLSAQLWDRLHLCCGKAYFTPQPLTVCLAPGGHVLNNERVLYSVHKLVSLAIIRFTTILFIRLCMSLFSWFYLFNSTSIKFWVNIVTSQINCPDIWNNVHFSFWLLSAVCSMWYE